MTMNVSPYESRNYSTCDVASCDYRRLTPVRSSSEKLQREAPLSSSPELSCRGSLSVVLPAHLSGSA